MLHAFNIVAWTKLMTLTNESTYFAFQMIWEEIVNLFLFHGVPGLCCPSGGDLSQAASPSHSPTSPWLSCWSLVTSQAGVKLSLAPAASISGAAPPWQWPGWRRCKAPPAAQRPGSHIQQKPGLRDEKVQPRNHLSSPVSSQVNTKQILWINEFHTDSGEAVFVIIHNLPIVDCSRHLWKLLFQ